MAARDLTVNDVEQALLKENIELPAGSLESEQRITTVRISRGYRQARDFEKLVYQS